MDNAFKCRWCDFTVLKWRKNEKGFSVSGWPRLKDHIEEAHEDEYEKLQEALGADDTDCSV
jgi:hypothetical protein